MITITSILLWRMTEHYKHSPMQLAAQHKNMIVLAPAMNQWFPAYQINTPLRIAHFLAQSIIETAQFSSLTEHPKHGGLEYAYTTHIGKVLGNQYPGDGPKYIGRGLLDMTGRSNYKTYGNHLHLDLLGHPDWVASSPAIAVRTACDYWRSNGLNNFADKDDIMTIILRINGGYKGKRERIAALERIKKVLGIK